MAAEDGVYIPNTKCYLGINKDEMMPFPVTGKKPEITILSEVSETGKRGIIGDYFWWNLKWVQMNIITKEKQPHRLGE